MNIAVLLSMAAASRAMPQSPGQEDTRGNPQSAAREDNSAENKSRQAEPAQENGLGLKTIKNIVRDQRKIWTSPAHLRLGHADWLVPYAGVTAGFLVTDRDASLHLSNSPSTLKHYRDFSNYGLTGMGGAVGGIYLWGKATNDPHKQETGVLSGEAAVNALLVAEVLKYSFGRERPTVDASRGKFWQGGDSFPSGHAALSWAAASVISHEYPGLLTKILAYGAASAISISRVESKRHFPSDALVGSGIGWFAGWQAYRAHHNRELGGGIAGDLSDSPQIASDRTPSAMGSPYVPLDSWIYPVLDRLAALGLFDDAILGMKPWTRLECARLVSEAGDHLRDSGSETEAARLYDSLRPEFSSELLLLGGGSNNSFRLESIYARATQISGPPLTDGNYFGQTITNDFGRPYQEGFNSVEGISAWTTSGRWAGYIRAEYQHAASAPAEPLSARKFMVSDGLPGVPPGNPFAAVNQVQLLDAYAGLTIDNWQLSFGKQSLWWSPMQSGPLMFSDNAEPINMLRISRVSPFKLPSIPGWLGPIRVEIFMGQLTGHNFVMDDKAGLVGQSGVLLARQPMLHGEKFSFKPTANFEFSVNETTVFAGGPTPLTGHNFLRSYTLTAGTLNQGDITDPRSGVDFSYRIPGLRKWLTLYGDAFNEDEPSPIAYPKKAAFQFGLYIPTIPLIPKLDLRLEGGTTAPFDFPGCAGCFYDNTRYPGGSYLNSGSLIGSWLGRGGQGERVWSTYWLSSRNKIQFQFRHQKVDGDYLPQGGTLNDGGVNVDFQVRPAVTISGSVQYEKWNYPILSPGVQSNVTTSLQLTFWPHFQAH